MANDAKNRPVYVISIAAELVDMHPQTLRLYERKQLIRPRRSSGKTRLYSERDIEHLREIRRLTQELGVNLAGVEEVMRLQHELDDLQDQFEQEVERLSDELEGVQRRPIPLPAPGSTDPRERPVYVISIAAQLAEMHPQTLRLYERKQLIAPRRSSGKTRLYSEQDVEHLREIRRLTQELGVNLAGVEEIMRLRAELDVARGRMENSIERIQQDITERMTQLRSLPAPPPETAETEPESPAQTQATQTQTTKRRKRSASGKDGA